MQLPKAFRFLLLTTALLLFMLNANAQVKDFLHGTLLPGPDVPVWLFLLVVLSVIIIIIAAFRSDDRFILGVKLATFGAFFGGIFMWLLQDSAIFIGMVSSLLGLIIILTSERDHSIGEKLLASLLGLLYPVMMYLILNRI